MKKRCELIVSFSSGFIEAGCDEAGRGCLAGPVFAAAVILKSDFHCSLLNDSKQLSAVHRNEVRQIVESEAMAWAVASIDNTIIDRINILQASYLAMHEAVKKLNLIPELLLIDGNRFKPFSGIKHECFVKGDARFMSIAAASVLAKTHRDEFMLGIHEEYPQYRWDKNKGYPTVLHREAIRKYGLSPYHRLSFHKLTLF